MTQMEHELVPWSEALERGDLTAPFCAACDRTFWPPRCACPQCLSTEIDWRVLPPTATLYTWTEVHRTTLEAFAGHVPYVVGVLDFEESGIRLIGFVDAPCGTVAFGQRFRWRIDRSITGDPVPLWEPERARVAA